MPDTVIGSSAAKGGRQTDVLGVDRLVVTIHFDLLMTVKIKLIIE